jgi:hypothetical protein
MTTLTERYIAAATRSLSTSTQADVREELQAAIADDVEARIASGESAADAEYAVIMALGDPDALAASYADRPLHLIGPKYYLTWWRLLKLLWAIVPAVAMVGVIIGKSIAGSPIDDIIGTAISVGIGAAVHLAFWVTLVFFVLERSGADTGVSWTPDALPASADSGAGRGELISTLVFLGIMVAVLLWDRFIGVVFFATEPVQVVAGKVDISAVGISLLHPGLWPWWMGGLFVVIALEASLAIAVYVRRGWTKTLAAANTVLALAVAIPAIWLLSNGLLINPEVVTYLVSVADVSSEVPRILATIIGLVIAGVAAWDIIDGWLKTRRRPA